MRVVSLCQGRLASQSRGNLDGWWAAVASALSLQALGVLCPVGDLVGTVEADKVTRCVGPRVKTWVGPCPPRESVCGWCIGTALGNQDRREMPMKRVRPWPMLARFVHIFFFTSA